MELENVKRVVGDTPFMTLEQASELRDFIAEKEINDILELGFLHGVSTCYLAASLEARGTGHIHAMDLDVQRRVDPNAQALLSSLGLSHRATLHFEPTSYTWRLMKMLDENPEPRFDFCYLDGAHSWFVDGFAFFLVDRLLRPGGWILFDDFDWSYAESPALANTDFVAAMPEDERTTPQIRKVVELLVEPHPDYGEFHCKGQWYYARKLPQARGADAQVKRVRYREIEQVGLGALLLKVFKKLREMLRRARR